MTSIEVPDWVTEIAEDARVHCLNALTAYGSAGVDERYHMAMRAALTAALGAWVVQVGVAEVKKLSERTSSYDIAPRDWSFYLSDGNHTLYTLRQEKPDVLP